MRWFWIDTLVDFVSGERASGVKNVSLAEDYLHDHFPGYPVMPPTLMIEGMAQTAGILVGEARGFAENVILAKIRRAEFDAYAHPGDQIRYDATVDVLDDRAGVTSGTIRINGKTAGRVDLIFSHIGQADKPIDGPSHNFAFTRELLSFVEDFRKRLKLNNGGSDER